jgi:RNA polymerase sigma-70 factor (ECF subfamily)
MNQPQTGDRSDEDLLTIYRDDPDGIRGRRAAGEALSRYRGRVYQWCHRMVRHHERALDLAQDVLLKAWTSLPSFAGRSRFSSWLYAIARNECLTALRPRTLRHDPNVDPLTLMIEHADPAAVYATREQEEEIESLMREALNPVEQEAVWLRCFEGLPVPEVTRLLGLTHPSGARSVLQSAREKLRAAARRREST